MAIDVDPLGADKLLALWLETREMDIRDQLVAHHLPLVTRLCRRFQHLGEPLDDLLQVGATGLVKAIDSYHPRTNANLATFAIPLVVKEITNHFIACGWAAKLPSKLQGQKLLVDRAVKTLTQSLGRSPTAARSAKPPVFPRSRSSKPLR